MVVGMVLKQFCLEKVIGVTVMVYNNRASFTRRLLSGMKNLVQSRNWQLELKEPYIN